MLQQQGRKCRNEAMDANWNGSEDPYRKDQQLDTTLQDVGKSRRFKERGQRGQLCFWDHLSAKRGGVLLIAQNHCPDLKHPT